MTSREISTAQALSDCGLNPRQLRTAIGVARTHPIRVAGDSGNLEREISWKELGVEPELTTTTKVERRIGRWEPAIVARACRVCGIDAIALTFVDYLDASLRDETVWDQVDAVVGKELRRIQNEIAAPIRWVATGFGTYVAVPPAALTT